MSFLKKERKKILITGGPTNEYIDEVMKITNMSTGSFSLALAQEFYKKGYDVTLILNRGINTDKLPSSVEVIPVETTDDMLYEIEQATKANTYDVAIHAAAVGDYKADFSFLLEDLAEELFEDKDNFNSPQEIYDILVDPKCKLDSSSKISSYQSDLTVKLTLTPKIIGKLRQWMPDTLLLGCKLLENVPKEELYGVAKKLCNKNDMDFIMANDLADLRRGEKSRYLVNKRGFTGKTLDSAEDVYNLVEENLDIRKK